jgi:hypothetical protein
MDELTVTRVRARNPVKLRKSSSTTVKPPVACSIPTGASFNYKTLLLVLPPLVPSRMFQLLPPFGFKG